MREGIEAALTQLHAALDVLFSDALDGLSDDETLAVVREVEVVARRVVPVQERLAAEVDRRGMAFAHGCAKTSVLLAQLLRLTRPEATARMKAARRFTERHALTGDVLPPLHPTVAAAQQSGDISARHAAVIVDAIDALPDTVDDAGEIPQIPQIGEIEEFLVEQACQFPPDTLSTITRRLVDTLDPDGTLRDSDYRDRRRSLRVDQRPDGSVTGTFDGTAEFGELPSVNGVAATVILTATSTQWQNNHGLVRTGHGALIPTLEARQIAGEARYLPITVDTNDSDPPPPTAPPELARIFRTVRPVTGYGNCARLFTQNQKLAFTARDGGCSFPGCTVPALWCQADHITAWTDGGPTSITNGHLLCRHHHREKDRQGWQITMINQLPHWIPPTWLDPHQTPRHNHAHHPISLR